MCVCVCMYECMFPLSLATVKNGHLQLATVLLFACKLCQAPSKCQGAHMHFKTQNKNRKVL